MTVPEAPLISKWKVVFRSELHNLPGSLYKLDTAHLSSLFHLPHTLSPIPTPIFHLGGMKLQTGHGPLWSQVPHLLNGDNNILLTSQNVTGIALYVKSTKN